VVGVSVRDENGIQFFDDNQVRNLIPCQAAAGFGGRVNAAIHQDVFAANFIYTA
jgi:hypothetical protein